MEHGIGAGAVCAAGAGFKTARGPAGPGMGGSDERAADVKSGK